MASTSNIHATRSFAQGHSFGQASASSTITSAAAVTPAVPPLTKKPRTETRVSAQSVQVQKQPQQMLAVDPLGHVPMQAPTTQHFDPLQSTSTSYDSHPDDTVYGHEEMIEEPELYQTNEVKDFSTELKT
jgi:hypothetical protein